MHELRYPIGEFTFAGDVPAPQRIEWIEQIAQAPAAMRAAAESLSPDQLDTPYRPGGWTARQVIHHVPDSHLNAYCRFKLALTEDTPAIKPYQEAKWAELEDSRKVPIDVSLTLLEQLHIRWVALLRAMGEADWRRSYSHPEYHRTVSLEEALGLYAWHGRHHVAHVNLVGRPRRA